MFKKRSTRPKGRSTILSDVAPDDPEPGQQSEKKVKVESVSDRDELDPDVKPSDLNKHFSSHDERIGPSKNYKQGHSFAPPYDSRNNGFKTKASGTSHNSQGPLPAHRFTDESRFDAWKAQRKRQFQARKEKSQDSDVEDIDDDDSVLSGSDLDVARDWYMMDDEHDDHWDEYADIAEDRERQAAQMKIQQRSGNQKVSARHAENVADTQRWENSRLAVAGVNKERRVYNFDELDKDEQRTHLLVKDRHPPFLDGRTNYTKRLDPVNPLRDPTGDMALFAKKGSKLVADRRTAREKERAAADATKAAGTAIGNVTGVKEVETDERPHGTKRAKPENEQHQSDFSRGRSLQEQRKYLPAFASRDALLRVIRENQITVVIGETGSGKTTQLAQFLNEEGYSDFGMVACTQPRRVAAMSVAKRVAEEMDTKLGDRVGYVIRFEDVTSEKTVIKYMTDGILLREALTDPDLDKYSVIVIDEAHERSLNTDLLLGLLRKILARRRDLKLIVTSATMNAQQFSEFFGDAPTFTIPGRTFPVDVYFSKTPSQDYVDSAVRKALEIHITQPPGDILVFMTGQEDIEVTCSVMNERLERILEVQDKENPQTKPMEILPIYSQMPADLQAKIFDPTPDGRRKCVIATNIAETSLTIDGIMYVIDCGFSKLKVYNPRMAMDSLQVTPISQANANQRAGRAGRTGAGSAYRLYTEFAFRDEFFQSTIPEILRTNLANTVLLLKSLRVDNLLEFDFIDPPPQENLLYSMYQLWVLGALDDEGQLTSLGQHMSAFPMDPALSKLLLASVDMGCSDEVLTLIAMLSVPSVFYRPKERQDAADAARDKFLVPESDHLTLLHVYTQWQAFGTRDDWAAKHFLHARVLHKARDVRTQLVDIMHSQGLPVVSCGADWDAVRRAVCAAYFYYAARAKSLGQYQSVRTGMTMHLHPTSALFGLGFLPEFAVYHDLVLTNKEYMSVVSSVDPMWLAEYGSVFYEIRT